MTLKSILKGATLLLMTVGLIGCSPQTTHHNLQENIQEKGKLVVAISPDYAPFEFKTLINGKDTIVGADVELAKAIADELGVSLELSAMNFDNVLASLKTGKADLAISGLSITAERAKAYDFSEPYYSADNAILIQSSAVGTYKHLNDFSGMIIAVQKGSIEEGLAKDQLKQANIVSLTAMGEAINELKSGQVQAVVLEKPVAAGSVAQSNDLAISSLSLTVKDKDAKAVAMPKNNPELKKTVDTVINKWRQEDKYQQAITNATILTNTAKN